MRQFAQGLFKWKNGASWSYADVLNRRSSGSPLAKFLPLLVRLFGIALLIASITVMSWWVGVLASIVFFFIFPFPVEAILALLVLDIVSGGVWVIVGTVIALPILLRLKRR